MSLDGSRTKIWTDHEYKIPRKQGFKIEAINWSYFELYLSSCLCNVYLLRHLEYVSPLKKRDLNGGIVSRAECGGIRSSIQIRRSTH